MNLFIELNNLALKYRFYPKKGSGIHFITKKELIKKIISLLELNKSDKVFEANAGEFFIAREISKNSSLTAFEKRKELIPLLKKELPEIKFFSSDFLSFSGKLNQKKCFSFLSLDNPNEFFLKLLSFDFKLMILLLQKEFSQKILAEPGFKEYSALTVFADTFFELKEAIEVKPDSFYPRTSSDFFLIKFKRKKKIKIKNKKEFFEFVKALFRFKNRVFFVAIKKALPLMKLNKKTRNKMKSKIKEIEFNKKLYLMETEDFVELFNLLAK